MLGLLDVVHRDHVRVTEPGHRPRLAHEPGVRRRRHRAGHQLQCDLALQPGVVCPPHDAHPAAAELAEHDVAADLHTGPELCGGGRAPEGVGEFVFVAHATYLCGVVGAPGTAPDSPVDYVPFGDGRCRPLQSYAMTWFFRPALALVLLAAGCSDLDEAASGSTAGDSGSDTGATTASGPTTMPPADTTASMGDASATSGTDTTSGGDTSTTSGVATDSGSSGGSDGGSTATSSGMTSDSGGTSSTSAGSSSSTGAPECMGDPDCGANEICDMGTCVPACMAWGAGNWGGCLDTWGGFDAAGQCGVAGAVCLYAGLPIDATTCSPQDCNDTCDCPAPPATGDATVTCGDITGIGGNDCYLSCAGGETCPNGMSCVAGTVCMEDVGTLPMYGNCGNVNAPCAAGLDCISEAGNSVCLLPDCNGGGDCDPGPPGTNDTCDSLLFPPLGSECVLSCQNGGDCYGAMVCFDDPDIIGNTGVCMWPSQPAPGGSCCNAQGSPGCDAPFVEACVCALDSFCCSTQWDNMCVDEATGECNAICP